MLCNHPILHKHFLPDTYIQISILLIISAYTSYGANQCFTQWKQICSKYILQMLFPFLLLLDHVKKKIALVFLYFYDGNDVFIVFQTVMLQVV